MNPQYRSTAETRREAKYLTQYLDGERDDIPGATTRILLPAGYVKTLRAELGHTQKRFARLLGVQLITVQSWEQEIRNPDNMAALLILLLGKHKPVKAWLEALTDSPREELQKRDALKGRHEGKLPKKMAPKAPGKRPHFKEVEAA